MAPPTWQTKEQQAFVALWMPEFLVKKAAKNLDGYWRKMRKAWYAEFPKELALNLPVQVFDPDPNAPPPRKLTAEEEASLNDAMTTRNDQLRNAFFNGYAKVRAQRGGASRSTSTSKGLAAMLFKRHPKPTRRHQVLEVYQREHKATVQTALQESEFVELNEAAQRRTADGEWIDDDDEEEKEARLHDARSQRMTVQRRVIRECWEAEDEAVQQEVVAKAMAEVKAPRTEEKDGEDGERTPEEYQMSLDESLQVAEVFLTEFARMTGWVGTLVYAGPVPQLGGDLGFKSYSFGLAEGVNFEDYHSNWKKAVVTPLCKFARKAIPRTTRVARAIERRDSEEDEPASEPAVVVAPPQRPHKSQASKTKASSKAKASSSKAKVSSGKAKASSSKANTPSAMTPTPVSPPANTSSAMTPTPVSPPASRSPSPSFLPRGAQKTYQDYENDIQDYGDASFFGDDTSFATDNASSSLFLGGGASSGLFLDGSASSSALLGDTTTSSAFLSSSNSASAFLGSNSLSSTFLGGNNSPSLFLSNNSSTTDTLSFDEYVNAHPEMLVRRNLQIATNDNDTFGDSGAGGTSGPWVFPPSDGGGQGLHWTSREQQGEGNISRSTVNTWGTPGVGFDLPDEETATATPKPRPAWGGRSSDFTFGRQPQYRPIHSSRSPSSSPGQTSDYTNSASALTSPTPAATKNSALSTTTRHSADSANSTPALTSQTPTATGINSASTTPKHHQPSTSMASVGLAGTPQRKSFAPARSSPLTAPPLLPDSRASSPLGATLPPRLRPSPERPRGGSSSGKELAPLIWPKSRPPANEPKRLAVKASPGAIAKKMEHVRAARKAGKKTAGAKRGAGNTRTEAGAEGGEAEREAGAEGEIGTGDKGKGRQLEAPAEAPTPSDAEPALIHSITSVNPGRLRREAEAQKTRDRRAAAEYKANSRLNNPDGNHPLVVVPLPPDAPRPRRAPAPRRNMGAIVTLTDELQAKKDAALLEALKGSGDRMAANLKRATAKGMGTGTGTGTGKAKAKAKATGTGGGDGDGDGDGGGDGDGEEGGERHDQEGERRLFRRCCGGAEEEGREQ
ncbi:hypothetical protein C8F04DRAFT_1272597 [Mycena alexandri]|uniref:Uncharacterized protein n=1 Tax=Mycena alexandri TaxID=1745969 RepID=A0AAD6S784_9AGAR|nr:hypothetical protein C8F04DRAFT_1272597 [Mycena alexandri]